MNDGGFAPRVGRTETGAAGAAPQSPAGSGSVRTAPDHIRPDETRAARPAEDRPNGFRARSAAPDAGNGDSDAAYIAGQLDLLDSEIDPVQSASQSLKQEGFRVSGSGPKDRQSAQEEPPENNPPKWR